MPVPAEPSEEEEEDPDLTALRDGGWLDNGQSSQLRYTFGSPGEALRFVEDLINAGVPSYMPTVTQVGPYSWRVYCDSKS